MGLLRDVIGVGVLQPGVVRAPRCEPQGLLHLGGEELGVFGRCRGVWSSPAGGRRGRPVTSW
eukprot:13714219-Heterocapsa_arctica.AAC.1